MTGGSFIENTAQGSGGGLFVQGGMTFGYSTAHIDAGIFKKNKALKGAFGGGAIYVNGSHLWENFSPGQLYLKNALIMDNTAEINGGGYAACPSSATLISVKNGAAIVQNKAPSGREIHINGAVEWYGPKATPNYDIANSMLGGAPYHWMYDDGKEVPLNLLYGKLIKGTSLNLKNEVTKEGINTARGLSKVIISENYAGTRGGGIGSNGNVYIGTVETIKVTAKKTWNDDNNKAGKRPSSINVALYRAVEGSGAEPIYIGYNSVEPDADGNWSTTFNNLAKFNNDDKAFVYTVKEKFDEQKPIEYISESTGSVSGQDGKLEIVNTYETTEISGSKTWNDNNNKDGKRPNSITIRVLKNGKKEVASKEVKEADDWAWKFTGLAKYENGKPITYTIKEDAVKNYSSEVSGYNVTNTYKPSKPNEPKSPPEPQKPKEPKKPKKPVMPVKVPKTGDSNGSYLWLGLMCVSMGGLLLLFRRKTKM